MDKKALCELKSFTWYYQSFGQKNYCHRIEFAFPVRGKWKNCWLKQKWEDHLGSSEAFVQGEYSVGVVIKHLQIHTCRNMFFKITFLYPSLTITASLPLSRKTQISNLSWNNYSAFTFINLLFTFCQLKIFTFPFTFLSFGCNLSPRMGICTILAFMTFASTIDLQNLSSASSNFVSDYICPGLYKESPPCYFSYSGKNMVKEMKKYNDK